MTTCLDLASALLLGIAVLQGADASPDGMWRRITAPDRMRAARSELDVVAPTRLALFRLQVEELGATLKRATPELTDESPIVRLPMPDGSYPAFRVQITEVMSRELAASLSFVSYRGESPEDPRLTARFEMGPEGLRAVVFAPGGRVFVEPFRSIQDYVAYSQTQAQFADVPQRPIGRREGCSVSAAEVKEMRGRRAAGRPGAAPPAPAAPGTVLRTYRLAMAATGEYVARHGGTVDGALRAIGATVQRINEVYERELGITFRLVDRQRDLVFQDKRKDPFTNSDINKLLAENQRLLDSTIGTDAYDLGHVFATGDGGKAFPGVCDAALKGQGATGRPDPVGDPFDIDYVAHEIGHQLGANHTFNTTLGACGKDNRWPETAFEPGSGSTVLSYAGICDAGDLQPNSHPYFHVGTLGEIRDYVSGPGQCATQTPSKNTPPVVTVATATITIPRSTPFRLTGSATDQEQRRLLYAWEEIDTGVSSPPEGDVDYPRPLFRSNPPDLSPDRLFPTLEVLRSAKPRLGEILPSRARTMRFRLTARDGARPTGGFGSADVTVNVSSTGPLAVIAPAPGATVTAGVPLPVTWAVNGTDVGDVACGTVAIRLSLDDAATAAHDLVPSTPNDGAETVDVPAGVVAARGRIFVECTSQPFFALSGPIAIAPPGTTSTRRGNR